MGLHEAETVNGHRLDEVVSALQKAIRRSEIDNALYWGVDMWLSGYEEYAWKRLKIIASEDIGIAERDMPAQIQSLYSAYKDQSTKKDVKHEPERLFFVHAILLLATAEKSRLVDNALICHFLDHDILKREIPDEALDKHTLRGRQKGRSTQHFFDEGALLIDGDLGKSLIYDDPYEHKALSASKAPQRLQTRGQNGNLF